MFYITVLRNIHFPNIISNLEMVKVFNFFFLFFSFSLSLSFFMAERESDANFVKPHFVAEEMTN